METTEAPQCSLAFFFLITLERIYGHDYKSKTLFETVKCNQIVASKMLQTPPGPQKHLRLQRVNQ